LYADQFLPLSLYFELKDGVVELARLSGASAEVGFKLSAVGERFYLTIPFSVCETEPPSVICIPRASPQQEFGEADDP